MVFLHGNIPDAPAGPCPARSPVNDHNCRSLAARDSGRVAQVTGVSSGATRTHGTSGERSAGIPDARPTKIFWCKTRGSTHSETIGKSICCTKPAALTVGEIFEVPCGESGVLEKGCQLPQGV
ncbi:hypothetical protein [Streptomyces cinereoruber]|uniref:hypothetical protein n=1 Tax=Streptomyces cinereoruber TaxID=67260 RepID=UPI0036437535